MRRFGSALLLALVCVLLAGCLSARGRCRVAVANAGDQEIASVVVRDDTGNTYAFTSLAPDAIGQQMRLQSDMSARVMLEITGPDGVSSSKVVRLDRAIPHTFDGRILFQIGSENRVRTFVMPRDRAADQGVMPWAVPPTWQGVPGIPGLTGQE